MSYLFKDSHRFYILARKLDDALTAGGMKDDVVAIKLTKWDTAFIIAMMRQYGSGQC